MAKKWYLFVISSRDTDKDSLGELMKYDVKGKLGLPCHLLLNSRHIASQEPKLHCYIKYLIF